MRYLPSDLKLLNELERVSDTETKLPKHWNFHCDYKETSLFDFNEDPRPGYWQSSIELQRRMLDEPTFIMSLQQLLYYDNGMWRMFDIQILGNGSVICSSQLVLNNDDQDPSDILFANEISRLSFDQSFSVGSGAKRYFEVFDTDKEIISWLKERGIIQPDIKEESQTLLQPWKDVADYVVTKKNMDLAAKTSNEELFATLGSTHLRYLKEQTRTGPFHKFDYVADPGEYPDPVLNNWSHNREQLKETGIYPCLTISEPAWSPLPDNKWYRIRNKIQRMCFFKDIADNVHHIVLSFDPQSCSWSYSPITNHVWERAYFSSLVKEQILSQLVADGYLCSLPCNLEDVTDQSNVRTIEVSSLSIVRPTTDNLCNLTIKRW